MTHASLAQQGIWVGERQGIDRTTAFHMPLAVWFEGALDVPGLLRACAGVLERHPLLSAAVEDVAGAPMLVPARERPPVTFVDLTGQPADPFLHIAMPFDLASGPLCRFTLARLDANRHVLLFVAHHLVFDGMSKDVLVRDLADAYAGTPLAPLSTTFEAAAEAQRARVAELLPEAREFWRERWREPQELVLPLQQRAAKSAAPGETVELRVPRDGVAEV